MNERSPTDSTDEGRVIDVSEKQDENAKASIRTTSDSTGNGEFTSLEQARKHLVPRVLTDDGTMIRSREPHLANALSAMRFNADPVQNETV
jgi:hypothetical protein